MIQLIKNSQRLSVTLAVIFFLAILISAYMLYSLPADLLTTAGYGSTLVKMYVVISITFALGAFAIYYSIISKRELVVYKEKSQDEIQSDSASSNGQKSTISLEAVKASLSAGKSTKDQMHSFLQAVCKSLEAGQGALYEAKEADGKRKVVLSNGYALNLGESASIEYEFGEGLVGQAAAEGKTLYVDDIPDGYIKIISGLGSASPRYLLIVPLKAENETLGVIEIASFTDFSEDRRKFVEEAVQLLEKSITG